MTNQLLDIGDWEVGGENRENDLDVLVSIMFFTAPKNNHGRLIARGGNFIRDGWNVKSDLPADLKETLVKMAGNHSDIGGIAGLENIVAPSGHYIVFAVDASYLVINTCAIVNENEKSTTDFFTKQEALSYLLGVTKERIAAGEKTKNILQNGLNFVGEMLTTQERAYCYSIINAIEQVSPVSPVSPVTPISPVTRTFELEDVNLPVMQVGQTVELDEKALFRCMPWSAGKDDRSAAIQYQIKRNGQPIISFKSFDYVVPNGFNPVDNHPMRATIAVPLGNYHIDFKNASELIEEPIAQVFFDSTDADYLAYLQGGLSRPEIIHKAQLNKGQATSYDVNLLPLDNFSQVGQVLPNLIKVKQCWISFIENGKLSMEHFRRGNPDGYNDDNVSNIWVECDSQSDQRFYKTSNPSQNVTVRFNVRGNGQTGSITMLQSNGGIGVNDMFCMVSKSTVQLATDPWEIFGDNRIRKYKFTGNFGYIHEGSDSITQPIV